MSSLPVLGAALPVEHLPAFRDWLFEKDRDLELQSFTRADVLDGDWRPLADRARGLLDGYNGRLGIHGPFWGLSIDAWDPEIRTVVTRRLMQGLEVCAALGATHMVVHSPFTAWTANNFQATPEWGTQHAERVEATMAPVVARARDQGTLLVLENIEDTIPSARKALVEALGPDSVGVSLDTGHAHLAHHMAGAPDVAAFTADAGTRLAHVHVQDNDGFADRHWQIGTGTIDWTAFFGALAGIDAAPRLVLELRDYATIPASMAFLADAGLAQ